MKPSKENELYFLFGKVLIALFGFVLFITYQNAAFVNPTSIELDSRIQIRSAAYVIKELGGNLPYSYRVPIFNGSPNQYSAELVYRYDENSTGNVGGGRDACPNYELPYPDDAPIKRSPESHDFADISARAIIASSETNDKKYLLFAGHVAPFNMVGNSLYSLQRDCSKPIYVSAVNPSFEAQRSLEWITSVYTRNGKFIYAIANNDWRACTELNPRPPDCDASYKLDENKWWWASQTSLVSINSGASFRSPSSTDPSAYVIAKASPKDLSQTNAYDGSIYKNPKGITGFYQSTNIMKNPIDKNYYMFTRRQRKPLRTSAGTLVSQLGMCLLRAPHQSLLHVPSNWKGYRNSPTPGFQANLQQGECDFIPFNLKTRQNEDVQLNEIRHLSFNTYLNKFIALGFGTKAGEKFVILLTTNNPELTSWNQEVVLIMPAQLCSPLGSCDGSLPPGEIKYEVRYPTLIDHDYEALTANMSDKNERRNFDISGRQPWMYFTYKQTRSNGDQKLDVVRMPIRLTFP